MIANGFHTENLKLSSSILFLYTKNDFQQTNMYVCELCFPLLNRDWIHNLVFIENDFV